MEQRDEINLLDYWYIIKKQRRFIMIIVGVASVAVVIISLLMTKIYMAEALITPISSSGGSGGMAAALASQFGGLPFLGGMIPGMSGTQTSQLITILRSRTLAENVINSANLMPVLFKNQWDEKSNDWKIKDPKKVPNMEMAVMTLLKSRMTFMDDKKNMTIKIRSLFENPETAAMTINTYIEELQKFINKNTFTVGKRNRLFIEKQLENNKKDFLEAGKEISRFYRESQVSSSIPLLDINVGTDMVVDAVQGDSSSYSDLQKRIEALISKKEEVEKKISDVAVTENGVVYNVPQQIYLQYITLRQTLLGKINALLTQQYEMAKIDEAKEDLAFQVIDYAVPPVQRFKPTRAKICIMTFIAALFAAVFLAFFREYLNRMKAEYHASRKEEVDSHRHISAGQAGEVGVPGQKPDKTVWKKIISDGRTPEMYKDVVKTEDEGPQA